MADTTPRRLTVERPTDVALDDVIATASSKCRLCPDAHPLRKCPKFRRMSPVKRLSVVKRYKHCINCLAHSHFVKDCRSRDRCMECLQEHHTMLHFHRRAEDSKRGRKKVSETSQSKGTTRRRSHRKRRAANTGQSTDNKNSKKSATHSQALKNRCACSGQTSSSGNGAIMAASNTPSGATIVINVLGR